MIMQIILTHEQADFDALASLLGAYLLYETAIPVLPRRMNRNVRAFITLYGINLPFVDQRDLPAEPIEQVILVDTQSMVSIKGVSAKTQVRVIDHHPIRENLPEDWSLTIEDIGATTTLLVEALRERNGIFFPMHATLLLLGIYEDTGSLTYSRTTARDLRSAAFLLEQGANLQIANDFLNHPMSTDQQALYIELQRKMEVLHVHGHTIILACGDAQEMDEELSTIAHKMRDVLDPDALFMVITTRSGVQMVARSTTDHINVAEIMTEFGGGGHERAAASLVREHSRDEICARLVTLLPDFVRPSITVSQIMSSRPQLLSPNISVEDAAEKMRRFGYEGFPVVKHGKVIGLLTRRAVDRALTHKYTKKISSLMDAGTFTVQPQDSIEHVQRVVTESGWGQIPVVHPETKEIIGIITRTDLLKTLAPASSLPGRVNLAMKLEAKLPAERVALLKKIAEAALDQRAALYIVGGFVRDLILAEPSLDFDLVVEGDAIALGKSLSSRYGGRVTSHGRFGTAKWHLKDIALPGNGKKLAASGLQELDLVSARTEFYTHPTALPTVERGSIKLDLHRRDFTINTLAMRLDGNHYGELHDYWGGLDDLHAGVVKVLHSLSFVDDPTRILRAIRFEQRLKFSIEARTMELLLEARPLIERLSGERIRHELNHFFLDRAAAKIMQRLQDLDLLAFIHPSLCWNAWYTEHLNRIKASSLASIPYLDEVSDPQELFSRLVYVLWFLRLDEADLMQVGVRLKLRQGWVKEALAANRLYRDVSALKGFSPSQLTNFLDEYPAMAIYVVCETTEDLKVKELFHQYRTVWRFVTPGIDGYTLKNMGVPPGPQYSQILGRLRDAWLDGEITNSDEESALFRSMLADLPPTGNS